MSMGMRSRASWARLCAGLASRHLGRPTFWRNFLHAMSSTAAAKALLRGPWARVIAMQPYAAAQRTEANVEAPPGHSCWAPLCGVTRWRRRSGLDAIFPQQPSSCSLFGVRVARAIACSTSSSLLSQADGAHRRNSSHSSVHCTSCSTASPYDTIRVGKQTTIRRPRDSAPSTLPHGHHCLHLSYLSLRTHGRVRSLPAAPLAFPFPIVTQPDGTTRFISCHITSSDPPAASLD